MYLAQLIDDPIRISDEEHVLCSGEDGTCNRNQKDQDRDYELEAVYSLLFDDHDLDVAETAEIPTILTVETVRHQVQEGHEDDHSPRLSNGCDKTDVF